MANHIENVPINFDDSMYHEPKMKECIFCDGTGKVVDDDFCGTRTKCEECHGEGKVEMTDEEIREEKEMKEENKYQL